MRLFLNLLLVLLTLSLLTACATKTDKEPVKVQCPACGTDFNAIFHTNF